MYTSGYITDFIRTCNQSIVYLGIQTSLCHCIQVCNNTTDCPKQSNYKNNCNSDACQHNDTEEYDIFGQVFTVYTVYQIGIQCYESHTYDLI